MTDMDRAIREAELIIKRQEQDRLFYQNEMARQKIYGIIVCLLTIAAWWFLSARYGQFEHGITAAPFLYIGFYLILTKKNWYREMHCDEETD